MSLVDIIIYGTHSREECIRKNQEILNLPEDHIIFDDRPNGGGVLYTADKAWRRAQELDSDWVCVLQDDVLLCNNFKDILEQICLNRKFNWAISLFNWGTRYFNLDDLDVASLESPYIADHILMGCAILMPRIHIKDIWDWIEEEFKNSWEKSADDSVISQWCHEHGIKTVAVVPSLVQHIGDVSLLDSKRAIRRSNTFSENPDGNWRSTKIGKLPNMGFFKLVERTIAAIQKKN